MITNKTKTKTMEDYEVMAFFIDHYGPGLTTRSALLRHLRTQLKRSCSQERFNQFYHAFLRKYAPEGLLKDK